MIENDDYDDLIFCSRNIEIAKIPSFIKCIKSNSFQNCGKLLKLQISIDSKLQAIKNDAFDVMPSTIFSIAKYIQNPTKRHCETPENIYFKDELYTFQNYNIDGIVYNCEFGKDRHKK